MILLLVLLILCCCCCCFYCFWWRALSKEDKERYGRYRENYTFGVVKTTEVEVKDLTTTIGQKYLNTEDTGIVDEEENLDYVDPAISARRSFFGFKQTKSNGNSGGGSDGAPQRDSNADYDADLELPKSHPSRLIRARKANKKKLKMSNEDIPEEGGVQEEISRDMLPPTKNHPKGVMPPQHRFTSVHQNAGSL